MILGVNDKEMAAVPWAASGRAHPDNRARHKHSAIFREPEKALILNSRLWEGVLGEQEGS